MGFGPVLPERNLVISFVPGGRLTIMLYWYRPEHTTSYYASYSE